MNLYRKNLTLAAAASAIAVSAVLAVMQDSEREAAGSVTLRCGVSVDNVRAASCLDLGPLQLCAFRFVDWPEPVFAGSTDRDYRAWMGGKPFDF